MFLNFFLKDEKTGKNQTKVKKTKLGKKIGVKTGKKWEYNITFDSTVILKAPTHFSQ